MYFQATCRVCEKQLIPKGIQEMEDGNMIMAFKKKCNCLASIIWVEIKI